MVCTEAARASFSTNVPLNAMYEFARTTLDRPLCSALPTGDETARARSAQTAHGGAGQCGAVSSPRRESVGLSPPRIVSHCHTPSKGRMAHRHERTLRARSEPWHTQLTYLRLTTDLPTHAPGLLEVHCACAGARAPLVHVGRRSDDIAGQRGSTAHTHTQTHSIPVGQSAPTLSTLPVRPGLPQLQRPNLARTSALRRPSRPSGPDRSVERSARAVHALCREKRGRAGVVRGG